MASSVVRSSFRTWAASVLPGVQYIDMIGVTVNPSTMPATWLSLEFDESTERRMDSGGPHAYEEVGRTYVIAASSAGAGDGQAFSMAEALCASLYRYRDAAIDLHVIDVQILSSVSQESDGRWFVIPIATEWERRFYAS